MTEILGIVASARPWGNSELLVRQAIRGAQTEGAAARLIRLTDLHLESCTGKCSLIAIEFQSGLHALRDRRQTMPSGG